MFFRYFLHDFEIGPFIPIIAGITLIFKFHMHYISVESSFSFRMFSASFFIIFLSLNCNIC
jgi:hypothetical protein